jgi:hypothetical protein
MPDWNQRVREALHGIDFYDPQEHTEPQGERHRYLIFQTQPSSYILKITLEALAGAPLERRDKKLWVADLVYRRRLWQLDDWKGSSWTLHGPPGAETDQRCLLKKLTAAARIVERQIDADAREKVRAGKFALANQFMRLYSFYHCLRRDAETLLTLTMSEEAPRQLETVETSGGSTITAFEMTAFNDYFAKWRRADAAAAGAVIFFFGIMEILFDASFAFGERRGLTYQQFRRKKWRERFAFIMDVTARPASDTYAKLLRVQERYRNVFTHAIPTFIIAHPQLGWIPAETRQIVEPQMNPIYAFNADAIRETFALFDAAMALFDQHDATWAASMYAKTLLPIPLEPHRVAGITKHATSRNEFEQEIARRIESMDYYINGGF